jgi:streptomycin 3"-adenylyltransferase
MEQVSTLLGILRGTFRDDLLAMYLHGSAASGDLKPQSAIDVIAITARRMTNQRRHSLFSELLRLSARHPVQPNGPRCIELIVFANRDLMEPCVPACADLVYGEWLRPRIEAGMLPMSIRDPENTIVLAQARNTAIALYGAEPAALLPDVPPEQIRCAMREAIPLLLANLDGDERNVLLTLARMWRAATTGEFVTKDSAAGWAAARMPRLEATTLQLAGNAYLGSANDHWAPRQSAAYSTAQFLARRIRDLL